MDLNELFDVVDDDDRVIGRTTRKEVHSKGYTHRSVLFYLLDKERRVFVNQRSASKEFYPAHWSIVLGGHLRSGENYDEAVAREAKEEADVDGKPVFIANFKRRFGDTDSENSRVYCFFVNAKLRLDHSEIRCGKFMRIEEVEEKMRKEKFLPETQELYKILKGYVARPKSE